MIEIIRERDNKKIIGAMIEGRSVSAWSVLKHDKEELVFDDAIQYDGYCHSIRVETFLNTMLEIDDDFAQEVNEILYGLEKDDSNKVIEILKEKYGDEIDEEGYLCMAGFTYNEETDLSRDIVYHVFEYEGDHYAFISVHYGADARVGFGSMVCFKVNDIDYFFIGNRIDCYNSETDEDYNVWELEDIATYNKEEKTWIENNTGHEIYLYTSADGF